MRKFLACIKNKKMKHRHAFKGMTLTELLVVLAILGVLLLLAFPVLRPLFAKTHALEAKTNLKHLSEYLPHENCCF